MARASSRPAWRLFLLATVCAATAFAPVAGAAPTSPAEDGCSMPDCHAALALNPETGFFVTVRNYPTARAARREALGTCRDEGARGRACTVLRVVSGDRCLGGAMTVEDGAIVDHAAAVRAERRAALTAAAKRLDGATEQRHRIAALCNG